MQRAGMLVVAFSSLARILGRGSVIHSPPMLLWLTWKIWVCNDCQLLAKCLYVLTNFNIAIFLDTLNVINVKLCLMVELIELYPFIPFLVTLIVSQGHRALNSFEWKFHVLIWLSWNFVGLLIMSSRQWMHHYFYFGICSRENIDIFPHFKTN